MENPVHSSQSIPDRVFFRIGDVAEIAGIKQHVLRYWEGEFADIAPGKSSSGQRVYRKRDVETVLLIKKLLYTEKYSIEGARIRLRELRKSGELANEKQEASAPVSAVQRAVRQQAIMASRRLVDDIEALNSRPIRETFKY